MSFTEQFISDVKKQCRCKDSNTTANESVEPMNTQLLRQINASLLHIITLLQKP